MFLGGWFLDLFRYSCNVVRLAVNRVNLCGVLIMAHVCVSRVSGALCILWRTGLVARGACVVVRAPKLCNLCQKCLTLCKNLDRNWVVEDRVGWYAKTD